MECSALLVLAAVVAVVVCKPLDSIHTELIETEEAAARAYSIQKLKPSLTLGPFRDNSFVKIRTKRGTDEECERLRLCKLHARSSHNFLAAFQLYFVNKENARLWDHRSRTQSDCERLYGDCYQR